MSDYTTERPDKKQFLLDMLTLTEEENFEIGKRLKDQAEYIESLGEIAWQVGHIKQDVRADVFKLAEKMEIPMDINKRPREFDRLYFGDGSKV